MEIKVFSIYEHHGNMVTVRQDMKGKHREFCLCYDCALFHPDDREKNCSIANAVYALNVEHGLVTPVWECPEFEGK